MQPERRVFHRTQKHAAPSKQIVVNTLVVFHHVPAWCGKRQAGLNNGKIHHFLIQRLIKQLLPGKIGQRQSAAPCERVLRRYDQVKGVVQDGGALDLRLQRPKGQIEAASASLQSISWGLRDTGRVSTANLYLGSAACSRAIRMG